MPSIPQPKRKKIVGRWWFWMLVVLILVIGGGLATMVYQKNSSGLEQFAYLQEKLVVEKRSVSKEVSTNGTVVPDATAPLNTTLPGTVKDILVSVGDEVEKDQTLIQLSNEKLKAPFDGRILDMSTFEGAVVNPGSAILTLGFRSNHIEFYASESEVIDLKVGQPVTITLPAYNNGRDMMTGSVSFVSLQKAVVGLGQTTDTGYLVKVTFENPPSAVAELTGLTADVEVLVQNVENVLAVEAGAIQYDEQDQPFVYLLPTLDDAFIAKVKTTTDVTSVLERQPVTLGFEGDEYVEITGGLSEGDEVLLYVPPQLNTGFPF